MSPRSRALIFDAFSGVSGDMTLGALLDLGLPLDWLNELVTSLALPGVSLRAERVQRGALTAFRVEVSVSGAEEERHLSDVLEIVERSSLTDRARERTSSAFRRLAEVEGSIHGMPAERVHFHEVGATDAIVDIAGSIGGAFELGAADAFTRPIAVGRGWIEAAHGHLPLPAPATLRLLEGIPVTETGRSEESTTPTGAAIVAELTGGRVPPAEYVPVAIGYGAGRRDPRDHPNCLRLILAELEPVDERMYVIQTDIDDMSPEHVPAVIEAVRASGAADVLTWPIQMKKGRTGIRIEALASAATRSRIVGVLLRESTTLGVRFWPVERERLRRSTGTVEWRGLPIRVKTAYLPDGTVRRKPEYDDVLSAARERGVPAREAWEELERRLESGTVSEITDIKEG